MTFESKAERAIQILQRRRGVSRLEVAAGVLALVALVIVLSATLLAYFGGAS